jgi:hypothetical protein
MGTENAVPGSGSSSAWLAGDVLNPALRSSLRDLNARFLLCLKCMPDEDLGQLGFPPTVVRLLQTCEAEATLIMAACPYALFDAAFRHHEYWRGICAAAEVGDSRYADFTAVAAAVEHWSDYGTLTEMALFFAWHLANTNTLATRLILGMSPATTELIRNSALPVIASAVRTRRRLLRPRWPQRTLFWRRLLAITTQSSNEEARSAQLLGIQLMATEGVLELQQVAPVAQRR